MGRHSVGATLWTWWEPTAKHGLWMCTLQHQMWQPSSLGGRFLPPTTTWRLVILSSSPWSPSPHSRSIFSTDSGWSRPTGHPQIPPPLNFTCLTYLARQSMLVISETKGQRARTRTRVNLTNPKEDSNSLRTLIQRQVVALIPTQFFFYLARQFWNYVSNTVEIQHNTHKEMPRLIPDYA